MENLTNIDSEVRDFFQISSLDSFLPNMIQLIMIIGSLATLFYLFWGGIQFITAGGNQEATKAAKEKISQAVIGLAILATVWVLWRLIVYFLGISSSPSGTFNLNIPTP